VLCEPVSLSAWLLTHWRLRVSGCRLRLKLRCSSQGAEILLPGLVASLLRPLSAFAACLRARFRLVSPAYDLESLSCFAQPCLDRDGKAIASCHDIDKDVLSPDTIWGGVRYLPPAACVRHGTRLALSCLNNSCCCSGKNFNAQCKFCLTERPAAFSLRDVASVGHELDKVVSQIRLGYSSLEMHCPKLFLRRWPALSVLKEGRHGASCCTRLASHVC